MSADSAAKEEEKKDEPEEESDEVGSRNMACLLKFWLFYKVC